jgi:hypothetical protein
MAAWRLVLDPKAYERCSKAGISAIFLEKLLEWGQKQGKPAKIGKKPVEIGVFPLTKVSESRKVNGGRVHFTRMNTGDHRR